MNAAKVQMDVLNRWHGLGLIIGMVLIGAHLCGKCCHSCRSNDAGGTNQLKCISTVHGETLSTEMEIKLTKHDTKCSKGCIPMPEYWSEVFWKMQTGKF